MIREMIFLLLQHLLCFLYIFIFSFILYTFIYYYIIILYHILNLYYIIILYHILHLYYIIILYHILYLYHIIILYYVTRFRMIVSTRQRLSQLQNLNDRKFFFYSSLLVDFNSTTTCLSPEKFERSRRTS